MMGAGGQEQRLVGLVDQLLDPLRGQLAVDQRQRDLSTAHVDDVRIGGVGRVDGRDRRVVPSAQTAHSDSPTSATNGPVSSKSA